MPNGVIISAGNSPYNVTAGQTDTNDQVISGGTMFVDSGGTAISTTVSGGGILELLSGSNNSTNDFQRRHAGIFRDGHAVWRKYSSVRRNR